MTDYEFLGATANGKLFDTEEEWLAEVGESAIDIDDATSPEHLIGVLGPGLLYMQEMNKDNDSR